MKYWVIEKNSVQTIVGFDNGQKGDAGKPTHLEQDGYIIIREATPQEAIPAPVTPTYQLLRELEYPSTSDMIVAAWEHFIENRPEAAQAIQAKRLAIKVKYPKP